MRFAAGETVTRLRASTTTDRYGNEIRDWSTATSTPYEGCGVARGNVTDETVTADRDVVVSDLVIYMPPAADVVASDRIEVRGQTCEVVGSPFLWRSPFTGHQFGLVVNANRVEG